MAYEKFTRRIAQPVRAEPAPAPAMPTPPLSAEVELWRAALSRIDAIEPPCPGFNQHRWPSVYREAKRFLDGDLASLAASLGWSTIQLLGVHRDVGAVRFDCLGALLVHLRGERIMQCTAALIRFKNGSACYRCDMPAVSIAIWDYRKERAG